MPLPRVVLRLSLVLSFCLLTPTGFADEHRPPHIEVTGTAVTKVMPDYIQWSLSLEAINMDPAEAKLEVDRTVANLLQVRDELDIAVEDFETGAASVFRETRYNRRTESEDFLGYKIVRQITIRQRDLDQFDAFLTAFAREGQTFSMSIRSSEQEKIMRETRIEAVKAAKAKAQELAEVLDVQLGMPLRIDASATRPRPTEISNRIMIESGNAVGTNVSFTPGAIEIRVQVQATFELLPSGGVPQVP
ncbi:MAG: SIMPL domain-containing protein [Planctomycetota bacterium]